MTYILIVANPWYIAYSMPLGLDYWPLYESLLNYKKFTLQLLFSLSGTQLVKKGSELLQQLTTVVQWALCLCMM